MTSEPNLRRVGIIVAHPDDETLWAGGTVLLHPDWRCSVFSLCRASDPDRAPKFREALRRLRACGFMGDLDDGPQQSPLPAPEVHAAIVNLVGAASFDLVLTHGPDGEYTRHRRHTETSNAVVWLWQAGRLRAGRLWLFAYDDGGGSRLPAARLDAGIKFDLPQAVWQQKYAIIRHVYDFPLASWEARATPAVEAFWELAFPPEAAILLRKEEELH